MVFIVGILFIALATFMFYTLVIKRLSLIITYKKNGIKTIGTLVNYQPHGTSKAQLEQIKSNPIGEKIYQYASTEMSEEQMIAPDYSTVAGIYEYEVNGVKYRYIDDLYSSSRKRIGSKATLYYMPNNPNDARLISMGGVFIGIFFSIVFFGIGVLCLFI